MEKKRDKNNRDGEFCVEDHASQQMDTQSEVLTVC